MCRWHESKSLSTVESILFTDKIMFRTCAGVATLFLFETDFLVAENHTILPDYGA